MIPFMYITIVVHVIHSLEFFISSRALSSRPRAVHVNHNPKLLIASKALNSRPKVVHVNHYPKLSMEI